MYDKGQGVPQDDAEPCVGIGSQQIKGTPSRRTTSGSGTPTARASRRTMPKPCVGIGSQQIKERLRAEQLGVRYATGQGVPQDDAEAVRWYRLSADQGTPPPNLVPLIC